MAYFKATLRDIVMPLLRLFQPSTYASDRFGFPQESEPMDSLVTDPVGQQAEAEMAFQEEQIRAGREVQMSGNIETAADEMNLRAFQDSEGIGPGPVMEEPPLPPAEPVFMGPPAPPEPVMEEPEEMPELVPDPFKLPGGF